MKALYPNRTFKLLIATSVILALLLGIATYQAILAGCPENHDTHTFNCLFWPTYTDIGIHLLSYILIGMILLGIFSGLVLWHRQWTKTRRQRIFTKFG